MIIAEEKGIHGCCILVSGTQCRNKHVANMVIGIERDYWRKGLGSELIDKTLAYAEAINLNRIELTVHTSNRAAIKLYKKFGFAIERIRQASINLSGQLVDESYMAKVITRRP